MNKRLTLCIGACTMALTLQSFAAEDFDVPRNAFGHPDLQGIWTNATQTPLVRPAELGEKRFLTQDEAEAREQRAVQSAIRADNPSDPDRAPPTDGNTAAAYNSFWLDRGTRVAHIDGEYRTSLIIDPPDGQIPLRADAPATLREQWTSQPGTGPFDGPELLSIGDRCLIFWDFRTSSSSAGPPMVPLMYNNNYQIVQTPDYVMILVEMMSDVRIIRLNDEPLPDAMYRWMGDSVGRWDGDTLVVTTTNMHPQQSHFGSTAQLTVTEHFTRVAQDKIVYRVTMDDPSAYTQPWTAEIPMHVRPAGDRIYEYACHEGNYALRGILAGARAEENQQQD